MWMLTYKSASVPMLTIACGLNKTSKNSTKHSEVLVYKCPMMQEMPRVWSSLGKSVSSTSVPGTIAQTSPAAFSSNTKRPVSVYCVEVLARHAN